MQNNIKVYTLTGAGTEIANFSVGDGYALYQIQGTAVAIGNYAITISGTPKQGDSFNVLYSGNLDITTNSKTFSILGQSFTQAQLNAKMLIICYYTGSAWVVSPLGSLVDAIISTANILDSAVTTIKINNGAVTDSKLATNSVTTVKINNQAVTTSKIGDLAVTDAKINNVDGSKVDDGSLGLIKIEPIADETILGNFSGDSLQPQALSACNIVGRCAWLLTGNASTDPLTNFIGTTDVDTLVFKVNNNTFQYWDSTLSNAITGSLFANNTIGYSNSGYGVGVFTDNTSGFENSAFGAGSLANNTTAQSNSGLGTQSLYNVTTGSYNTGLGRSSGYTINSGANNTIVGATADVTSASANNRIALGYGASADQDYQFALPDNVTKIKWRGITYTLPSSNGAGVLTNDGSGNLSWV